MIKANAVINNRKDQKNILKIIFPYKDTYIIYFAENIARNLVFVIIQNPDLSNLEFQIFFD